ncbi:hypothetical protein MUP77_23255 [Candidatus Bathyarchaeota archaeon]|nr:hypothetical protein [Candidatus Bathyarchaeota archaeon]
MRRLVDAYRISKILPEFSCLTVRVIVEVIRQIVFIEIVDFISIDINDDSIAPP